MPVDVLLGLQWGDEGKGKIVDALAGDYDIIARFQGGPNAGHTLLVNGKSFVLHTIPSGIFHPGSINLIGNGVVVDPIVLHDEFNKLRDVGVNARNTLRLARKAHLILPTHKLLDAASEAAKGSEMIGSTLRGIGPAYMDKTGRNGLRVGDILMPDFHKLYMALKEKHQRLLRQFDFLYDAMAFEEEWFEGIELIKSLEMVDGEYFINDAVRAGKKVLAEGAQGSMLDIEFGTYPFVTSSNTLSAGVMTGLGLPPQAIDHVIGITKAYCTRVGSGPFPTELFDQTGETLRETGREFGATTGRPRRCGWIDLVALKYAIMLNGVTHLAITKIDVLNDFRRVNVCVAYDTDSGKTQQLPYDLRSSGISPIYRAFEGWKSSLEGCTTFDEFPPELRFLLEFLEYELGIPVALISTGPERDHLVSASKKALLV